MVTFDMNRGFVMLDILVLLIIMITIVNIIYISQLNEDNFYRSYQYFLIEVYE